MHYILNCLKINICTLILAYTKQSFFRKVGKCALTSTSYPNFVILGLRFCRCCRHATKITKSPFESWNNFKTDSLFSIVAKLFLACKKFYFVNNEVRAGCPKLGYTILHIIRSQLTGKIIVVPYKLCLDFFFLDKNLTFLLGRQLNTRYNVHNPTFFIAKCIFCQI